MTPVIEIESLTKRYGRTRGIDDVNLTVDAGEIFGFIGPNGAGKSTTIRTILGFLRPTSGTARILGLDTVENVSEIHRKVGYLPADVNLYDDMRAGDLLRLAARFHGVTAEDRIGDLSAKLGLDLDKRSLPSPRETRKRWG